MTETGELQIRKELIISSEILRSTFTDPKFVSHLAQLVHHAHLNNAEGSFFVMDAGGPVISELNKSPRARSMDSVYKSHSTGIDISDLMDENSIEELGTYLGSIADGTDEKLLTERMKKANIFLFIHSHPRDRGEDPESVLRPSEKDLESTEEYMLKSNNPYLIKGIIVKRGNTGCLLLYQFDPHRPRSTYYQSWVEEESRDKLFRLMEKSGIRYEILNFDMKTRSFPEGELGKLNSFVVE